MKNLKFYLLALFLTGCNAAYDDPQEKTADEKLSELKAPVVVISTGTFMTDCLIKVIDSTGKILTIHDNSACSLQKGDTIK